MIYGAYAYFYAAGPDRIPPVTKLNALLKKPCFWGGFLPADCYDNTESLLFGGGSELTT